MHREKKKPTTENSAKKLSGIFITIAKIIRERSCGRQSTPVRARSFSPSHSPALHYSLRDYTSGALCVLCVCESVCCCGRRRCCFAARRAGPRAWRPGPEWARYSAGKRASLWMRRRRVAPPPPPPPLLLLLTEKGRKSSAPPPPSWPGAGNVIPTTAGVGPSVR